MKKIRVLLRNFTGSDHLIKTAVNIAKQSSASLHSFFLNPSLELVNADAGFADKVSNIPANGKIFFEEDAALLDNHSKYITEMCMEAGIKHNIKPEMEVDITKLIKLSSFDDLILADTNEEANNIADLLATVQCPVYLISSQPTNVENIILTYDGSLSSIHAIKMFSQLFPNLLHLPCHLVHVVSDENDEFPRMKNIKSWLPPLFSNVEFKILHGDTRDELVHYINQVPGSLAFLGASKNKFFGMSHKRVINAVISNGRSDIFVT